MLGKKKSEIISHVITPAIKFWLRSQLESIGELDINIDAGDKQILTGKINQVTLEAKEAIYRGIYINQAEICTENIAVNLGGILRGKPLKLLNPIYVVGEVNLTAQNLHNSLPSDLLQQALKDLVKLILVNQGFENADQILTQYQIQCQKIVISEQKLAIYGSFLEYNTQKQKELFITAHLFLKSNHELLLNPIEIQGIKELDNIIINNFYLDLGEDVELEELTINSHHLHCMGKIKVVS
jgi:hypothetical protein